MQFKTFLLASLASVAVAQTTTTACAAQNIVDACVATIQGILNSCDITDYTCKCTNYTNIISSCYAACPNDPTVGTYESLKAQNCAAMSAYGTTTVLGTASSTSAAASATTTHSTATSQSGVASSTTSRSSSSSPSSSASATSSSLHNSAQAVGAAGGLVYLVAAGFVALI